MEENTNVQAQPKKGFGGWLDRKFQLSANGTTVKTEVVAGITTFMTMAYILMVNAGMFSEVGISYNAVYIATALSAIVGTVLIGLLAKLPLAQASGMGLNAFFVYTIVGIPGVFGLNFSYANALLFVLVDGVIFVLLTVTGLRKKIFRAVPDSVRKAIPAAIGLFIAFIGAQNSGLIVANSATGVALGGLNVLNGGWAGAMPILVTIIGVVAIAVLSKKNVKGAILWGMLGSTALYYILGLTTGLYARPEGVTEGAFIAGNQLILNSPFAAFGEWGTEAVGKVFTEGFDFSGFLSNSTPGALILALITCSFSFLIVDMFDTMGTLYGACARGNMLTAEGEVPNMDRAMLADAIATCTGAIAGTSTVTTFVESSAGIGEGGRTGLTSIVVAIGFTIAMFLSPVAALIPSCATATALIYVGVLMMGGVKELEWNDPVVAVPSFLTIGMTIFTYSISDGIGFGFISYVLINLFTGKAKDVSITTYIIAALFLVKFLIA